MRVNISISEELYTLLCNYCKENGFKVSTLLQHLIKKEINLENRGDLKKIEKLMAVDPTPSSLEGERLNYLVNKVVRQEEVLYPLIKKTEKIVRLRKLSIVLI